MSSVWFDLWGLVVSEVAFATESNHWGTWIWPPWSPGRPATGHGIFTSFAHPDLGREYRSLILAPARRENAFQIGPKFRYRVILPLYASARIILRIILGDLDLNQDTQLQRL